MKLQLFAQERTEKATPRRRQKARERGQVFSSKELNSALILLTSFMLFKILGKNIVDKILLYFTHVLTNHVNNEEIFNPKGITFILYETLTFMGKILAPFLMTIMAVGIISNYLQVGFVLSFEPIAPKLERINPLEGLKRIFSRRSLLELMKSIAKIAVVGYVVFSTIRNQIELFPKMLDLGLLESIKLVLNIAFNVGIKATMTLLILSFFDYFYQWREHESSLMMSKQDLKEEHKEVEGNPQTKSRIRQIQRQMAQGRMMADINKADVVITNPTHYAVALAYDVSKHLAPMVIAKGRDKLAEKIKEVAAKEDVPMVENKSMAQMLYRTVDVGEAIPESLYNAVAEILAFVYSVKERRL